VNGTQIGRQPCPDRICIWPNVALKPGPNTLVAAATINGQALQDEIVLNGPDTLAGIHIDVGDLGMHVAADGRRFGSDNFGTGGTVRLLNPGGLGHNRNLPKIAVEGASDPSLFEAWREGNFSYAVPVPNGRWVVIVHSFEPDAAQASMRKFNILANDQLVVAAFNPAAAAGGTLKAATRSFPLVVTNGVARLAFSDGAIVAAIEMLPAK